ncbi:DUF4405 domain-containing protein [Chryseolinea sp. T2]|uniref:DUF4405 domain-containing protein n=1 Tax=Chryseolinea sp. T2 TaxID=3129255 RepID=UPI003076DE09
MKLNRKYITPLIALIFVVVATTGILMFFHFFDGYTEVVHELLGISFVACAGFHVMVNWPALKTHFGKNVFFPALIIVLGLSISIVTLERVNVPIDIVIMEKLIKAPIKDSFNVLGVDYSEATSTLQKKGIRIGNARTLEDIWVNNHVSPEDVIDAIMK